MVLLGQAVAGVHHAVGDVAVVGQEEQPLGVAVEAADRVDPLADIDQVHHRPPLALVARGGDVAARLVEEEVAGSLGAQQVAVDPDLGGAGIDLGPELGDDLAVDVDAARPDQFLRPAAGGNAARGEDSLQAFASVDRDFSPGWLVAGGCWRTASLGGRLEHRALGEEVAADEE